MGIDQTGGRFRLINSKNYKLFSPTRSSTKACGTRAAKSENTEFDKTSTGFQKCRDYIRSIFAEQQIAITVE